MTEKRTKKKRTEPTLDEVFAKFGIKDSTKPSDEGKTVMNVPARRRRPSKPDNKG